MKDGNGDPNKVKESLEAVNKDIEYLNRLRKSFASSLEEVSSINKQSSVAFSSSSEKGIEESIEREPLHNYEESEKQALRELKEISSKYILTDKEKENELSNFIKIQPSCRTKNDRKKFDELWKIFVRLSPDEKKKAILRIFFFAEFWDSSIDENALRNVVWEEVGKLNAKDYIFRKSVDYLISFASTPSPSKRLISTGKRLHSNGLRRVLSRAQSFLSKDETGNLIIRICIEIFNMRNTFNIGELFTSNKVKERLSTLKNFCEGGRKNKIADFTLRDYQDYKILRPLLKERSQPSVKSIIDYLIKKLEWEESTLKDL